MNLQLIDKCKPYPTAPQTFSIKIEPRDNVGKLREEISKHLGYDPKSFEFHLSGKDEATHLELFSAMTDVCFFFRFFFPAPLLSFLCSFYSRLFVVAVYQLGFTFLFVSFFFFSSFFQKKTFS